MVTALACFVIERGDSDQESLSPILLDELIELNKSQRDNTYPTIENYYSVKKELDELIRKEEHKAGLLKSKQRVEEERKRRVAEQKKKEEQKLVQLSKAEAKKNWQTFEITMYTAGYESTQKRKGEEGYGITASGEHVQEGVTIACSPDISFGTKIYIEVLDNTYTCLDRGSLVTSGKIDVYVNDLSKALQFGRQKSRGYIVKE